MHINRQTYEEYFLLYADGELNETEKLEVEEFVEQNPDLGGELELIRQTVMTPDETIVFANKEILFREEGDRRVVAMRWMRFAAAAAVLLALTVAGWIFLKDDVYKAPPVAVVQPQKVPVIEKSAEPKKVVETKEAVAEVKPSFEKNIKKKNGDGNNNNSSVTTPPEEENLASTVSEEPIENKIPEAAPIKNDVALNEPAADPIDIQVEPRAMTPDDLQEEDFSNSNSVHYTQALAEEREKGDQIYFANTQLSKKTKLRGVLRKASRYLERVTSIQ